MHPTVYKRHLGRLLPRSNPAGQDTLPGRQETFKSQCGPHRQPWADPLQRLFPKRRQQILSHQQVNFPPFTKATCCHTQWSFSLNKSKGNCTNVRAMKKMVYGCVRNPDTLSIDMGRVLGRCKTYVHHAYLFCGDTKPIWAREAIMVMKTLSVISYRASHSTWMLC